METKTFPLHNILITGGTSGLGLELVKTFLSDGCEVYAAGRDPARLPRLNNKLHFIAVDFSNLKAVSETVNQFKVQSIKFDLIINNAAILSPPIYTTTKESLEYTFQVNFLSHLLLDDLIIRYIDNKVNLRIVSVTSPVYKLVKPDFRMTDQNGYRAFKAYGESKLYLLLIGEYLRNKYPEKRILFIGFDPGTFRSGIHRMQKKWFQNLYRIAAPFMRSPANAAKALSGILSDQICNEGVIYNINAAARIIPYSDSVQARELFNFCEQKLAIFLT